MREKGVDLGLGRAGLAATAVVELEALLAGEDLALSSGAADALSSLDGGAVLSLSARSCGGTRKAVSKDRADRRGAKRDSPHPPHDSSELSVSMHS